MSGAGSTLLAVFVAGRPRTKGSLKPVHRRSGPGRCSVSLTESGQYSIPWKEDMITAIQGTGVTLERHAGPVEVRMFFYFERFSADEKLAWPTRQTGTLAHGDIDKLERNVLDALTQSGLIADDSLVVRTLAEKRFVDGLRLPPPGVRIEVTAL